MAIHPTAIVDSRAELDPTVDVGPYCIIDAEVRIAAGCRLVHQVYLTGWTEIGENCVLHPGVIVGHEPQDTKYKGQRSFCRIGRGTILREYVTVHRGTIPESSTVIGENCYLLGASHVAHNGRLGNHVTLINNVLLAGHVQVGDRVTIGGGAAVHQFVRVGELAMIAGNSRVTMDVIPFALTDPEGRIIGLNRVGLRRAGIPDADLEEVRRAFRLLFGGATKFQEAVAKLNAFVATHSGRTLRDFLHTESSRGFAGRTRRKKEA
jgi:UDP-N-acetylglucosamine acyltransferase